MKKLITPILLLGLFFPLVHVYPAAAESFIDIYGGTSSTSDAEVSVKEKGLFFSPRDYATPLTFEDGTTFGGRYGIWLETMPWLGLAGDISYFDNRSGDSKISVVPFTLLIMARYPLAVSPEFPTGRIQPYIGLGPSLMVYDLEIDLRAQGGDRVREDSSDFGFDVRTGVALQVSEKFALFGEYRFTRLSLAYDSDDEFIVPVFNGLEVDTDLETQHFLVGLSYRF